MKRFRITTTTLWSADSYEDAEEALVDEIDNPDSILFHTVDFTIEEVEEKGELQ